MRFKSFLLFLILLPALAAAQYSSNGGNFDVPEIKGCAPFQVNIINAAPGPIQTTWGDGASGANQYTHTFITPGTYRITIIFPIGTGTDFIDITVTPNIAPAFDIYTCNSLGAQVKVTDTNYDSYIINFGDGSAEVPALTSVTSQHTYGAVATYTINVRGKNFNAADNCTPPAPKMVSVVNTLTASVIDKLTVTSDAAMDLEFTGTSNVLYRVEYIKNASTGFQFAPPAIHDVSTTTITNSTIHTNDNYYCTRLGSFSPCSNTVAAYSNIVCSATFTANAISNEIDLAWNTSTLGVSNFDIERDGSALAGPLPISPFSYADNTVVCNNLYSYQLITNYSNGSQSISTQTNPLLAFSSDPPTAITDVTAVVGSGSVDLTWTQDPIYQPVAYNIYRKSGAGSYEFFSNSAVTTFTDPSYSTDQQYCYQINYTDVCDVESLQGVDVCPMRLTGKVNTTAGARSITLDWSAYQGWASESNPHYYVEKYDEDGTLLDRADRGSLLTYTEVPTVDVQSYRYIVVAESDNPSLSLGQAISNEKVITLEPTAIFPKAFTPNGDTHNDEFKVIVPENYQYIESFEMKIFNRWGEMIFSTKDKDIGWDGKYKGANQPEGIYVYTATLTDLTGETFKRSGSFVLLRRK